MKINIMTLFPEMFSNFFTESIVGRAVKNNIIDYKIYNIRDYSDDPNKRVDDYTYGGGSGMVMKVKPVYDCYLDVMKNNVANNQKTILLSPRGKTYDNEMAKEFSNIDTLNFICAHYEGIDERAIELINPTLVSIGDYVLTGGEIPAMVIIDSTIRFIKGVLNNDESVNEESFNNYLLEYPQYTRPEEYMGLKVPEILRSGDHKKVSEYRLKESIEITKKYRPDLYKKYKEATNE